MASNIHQHSLSVPTTATLHEILIRILDIPHPHIPTLIEDDNMAVEYERIASGKRGSRG